MNLSQIPKGEVVVIDANIVLYAIRKASGQCEQILRRCAEQDISCVMTSQQFTETLHRLMIAEAIDNNWITGPNPAKRLSEKPDRSLDNPKKNTRMKTSSKGNGKSRRVTYKYYARIIRNYKKELAEKYKVKEIGIFGSYARGEQRKRSDVDIIVDFEEVPDLFTFIRMERYLEKLLKKKVDLVTKPAIRPELKDSILQEVIYL